MSSLRALHSLNHRTHSPTATHHRSHLIAQTAVRRVQQCPSYTLELRNLTGSSHHSLSHAGNNQRPRRTSHRLHTHNPFLTRTSNHDAIFYALSTSFAFLSPGTTRSERRHTVFKSSPTHTLCHLPSSDPGNIQKRAPLFHLQVIAQTAAFLDF